MSAEADQTKNKKRRGKPRLRVEARRRAKARRLLFLSKQAIILAVCQRF